jgi:hypothetical protein
MVIIYNIDYIFQFFELWDENIRNEFENEEWNPMISIPYKYANILNLFKSTNLQKKNVDKTDTYEYFIYFETSHENTDTPMLDVYGKSYKATNCILYLIEFIYETIKILNIFDITLTETIVFQFSKIIITYVNLCKETILEGEGYKRGKLKTISQKELSTLCANMNIIKGIIDVLLINIAQEELQQSLSNILKNVQLVLNNSKQRIAELFIQM